MESYNTNQQPVLVVGATGNLGMEICRQLVKASKRVRALVRTTSSPDKLKELQDLGVEKVEGDIKNPATLSAAFQNVSALISTATSTVSRQEGDNIESVDLDGQLNVMATAANANVPHVVFVSFPPMEPQFPLQTAKRIVENTMRQQDFKYTILQPTYFMEVWLGPHLGFDYPNAKATIYGEGKNKITWIRIKDVASFAVAALDRPAATNATIELGGAEDTSVLGAVAIFEEESGQQFATQQVPREALAEQMEAAPDSLAKTFTGLMIGLNEVKPIDMSKTLRAFPVQLSSVRDYAREVAGAKVEAASL